MGTQKGSKSCLRVSKIDSIEESALQKINLPQGHRNRPHQRRHPSKGKQTKTCLKVNEIDFTTRRALQKINLPQGHRNRPNQRGHPSKGKQTKRASRSPKSTSPTRAPIKREANQNQEESSNTEGQKAILYYYEIKTTI